MTTVSRVGPTHGLELHHGFCGERLARIAPSMTEQIARGLFPGAVTLIARHGKLVQIEAHGHLDAAQTKPMTTDAIFRIASMTKPIVSVATLMAIEAARLKLDDPITHWLPELANLRVLTLTGEVTPVRSPNVQDLLTHTAGFVYGSRTTSARLRDLHHDLDIEANRADISASEMLRRLGTIPLAHQPGSTWEYSVATDVLGLLLERVLDQSLDDALRSLLFNPLGMHDTQWWVPETQRSRFAEALDSDPLKADMTKAYRHYANPRGNCYFKGGSGLVSTAADYLRFTQMVLNRGTLDGVRYLAPSMVDFMLSSHTTGLPGSTAASTGPGYDFGLGFAVRRATGMGWVPSSPGEAMWAGVWGSSFWIDRRQGLIAILMAQGPSFGFQSRMLFKNLVYGALLDAVPNVG